MLFDYSSEVAMFGFLVEVGAFFVEKKGGLIGVGGLVELGRGCLHL